MTVGMHDMLIPESSADTWSSRICLAFANCTFRNKAFEGYLPLRTVLEKGLGRSFADVTKSRNKVQLHSHTSNVTFRSIKAG